MSWDLSGSNYDKITMVLQKLGFPTEEGLYGVHVALGTENTLVVSPIVKDGRTNGAIAVSPLENEKNCYSILSDFCCVVAENSKDICFEFISDLEELKQKISYLKNHTKTFERLYFVEGEEISLVSYDSLDQFIADRIRITEEADARFWELARNGGSSWLNSYEEGNQK